MQYGLVDVEDSGNCPHCNAHVDLQEVRGMRENVPYGSEGKSVSVIVPVHTCTRCGSQWTNEDGSAVRDFAIMEAITNGE